MAFYKSGTTTGIRLNPQPTDKKNLYERICQFTAANSVLSQNILAEDTRLAIEQDIRNQRKEIDKELSLLKNTVDQRTTRRNRLLTFLSKCPLQSETVAEAVAPEY